MEQLPFLAWSLYPCSWRAERRSVLLYLEGPGHGLVHMDAQKILMDRRLWKPRPSPLRRVGHSKDDSPWPAVSRLLGILAWPLSAQVPLRAVSPYPIGHLSGKQQGAVTQCAAHPPEREEGEVSTVAVALPLSAVCTWANLGLPFHVCEVKMAMPASLCSHENPLRYQYLEGISTGPGT